MLNYDAKAVARLEKVYSSPQILDQPRRLRSILAARPGEAGLDVGCGVAYLACELAKEVAPGGRIAAIDNSRESVETSKARVAKEGLAGLVDVRVGDVLLVQGSFGVGTAILTEASLSFLGLGVPPPALSWGRMLREGYSYLLLAPWISIASGAAIFVIVLAFQMLSDGLRDVMARRTGVASALAEQAHFAFDRDRAAPLRAAPRVSGNSSRPVCSCARLWRNRFGSPATMALP